MKLKQQVQAGFTLVELLIVVIILAILAAIVIPQFTSSTTDAQESALDSNLAALRSAIELYRVQHGHYPGTNTAVGTSCPAAGSAGIGTAGSADAWVSQLLLPSDITGKTCTVGDPVTYKFGPYIRKGIPPEPITGKGGNVALTAATDIVVTSTGAPINPAAATGGWAIDTLSGQVVMNSNAMDSKQVAGKTYAKH